jgi:hypothetical protein
MDQHDLDLAYSALSQALAEVGDERSALLLATLSLALISRQRGGAAEVLPLIDQARRLAQT